MCTALAQGCGSSGMVLAMHHIQVACIARHGAGVAVLPRLPRGARRAAAAHRVDHVGGRRVAATRAPASAPSSASGDRFKLDKDATTSRTREHADDLLVTARRDAGRAAERSGAGARAQGRLHADADDDVGHDGHARHVQPGLQADVRRAPRRRSSRARSPTRRRRRWSRTRTSCGRRVWLGIATRRGRARARLRARRGAQEARHRAAHGDAPRRAGGRAAGACATTCTASAAEFDAIMARPTGMEELLTMGWALKMNNIKVGVVGDGAARSSTRRCRSSASWPTRTTRKLRSGASTATRCRRRSWSRNDRIFAQERVDAARAQGRVGGPMST